MTQMASYQRTLRSRRPHARGGFFVRNLGDLITARKEIGPVVARRKL